MTLTKIFFFYVMVYISVAGFSLIYHEKTDQKWQCLLILSKAIKASASWEKNENKIEQCPRLLHRHG